MKQRFNLMATYDTRASFYNLAIVEIEGDKKSLYSYNTLVCVIENNKANVLGLHSTTTLRHVREFLLQNGFKAVSKKQIVHDYVKKEVIK